MTYTDEGRQEKKMNETRERFDAAKWTPKRKVETRLGQEVRILCVDGGGVQPVVGIHSAMPDDVDRWGFNGEYDAAQPDSANDLFFADVEPDWRQLLTELIGNLVDLTDYTGGAANALEDEYVMERVNGSVNKSLLALNGEEKGLERDE